jgi:diguanylate cyclase (GGDEF)-like protein
MHIDIQSLLPFWAAIAYIPLLIIVASSHPWRKHHTLFVFFLLAGMLWSLSCFLLRSDYLTEHKVILFKVVAFFLILMVVQFYYFVRFFISKTAGWGTVLGYVSLATIIVGAVLNYIPQSFSYDQSRLEITLGWGVIPIVFIPVIIAADLIYLLIAKYRASSDPIQRNRIVYLLIAVALLYIFSIINSTPIGNTFPTAQIGQLINAALLSYATLKFKILDTNFLVRNGLIYSAMLITCLLIFGFWLSTIAVILNFGFGFISSISAAALTGISVSIFWEKARDFLYHKTNVLLYGESYDYRQKISDFVRNKIRSIRSLKEFSEGLLPPLVKVVGTQQAHMLLADAASGDFVVEFSEPPLQKDLKMIIKQNSPILEWLRHENRYLTRATLDTSPEFHGLWKDEIDGIKSMDIELLFPLTSRNNLIGILALSRKHSGKYTLGATNLVESIASQVAISLEKEYFQEELIKREQELSLLNRLALVITSSLNIQEVYEVFIAGLREVISVYFAAVVLVEGSELRISALSSQVGSIWEIGQKISLKGTATEWMIRHKKSLLEPNLEQDSMFYTGKQYQKQGIRSIVYLPLISKDEVIGGLIIGSCYPNAYSPGQINLLERLASQISTSVANSQLYARAEQRARIDELTGLYNRRHFDEMLKHEIDRHSRYGSMLTVALIDLDEFKRYNDTYGHLDGDKLLTKIGQLLQESVRSIDMAFRYGGDEFAIIMPATSAENSNSVAERIRSTVAAETAGSEITVTTSIGIASWPSDGLTTDNLVYAADRALYHAKQTGGNRTCLVSQMLPASTEILETMPAAEKETLSIIYALASTIEARDIYTYGHSQKVRAYAVALAEVLGLPSEKVAVISHAALLHDIGKIGIYDEVLNKAGKLSKSEFELIKTHPQLSVTIVGHVSSLTPCLQAIQQHHERWDGAGYPNGLKGESISLEGRILAIADAFDAMTSKRPYRNPMSYKEAIQELKHCSGTQFDPQLVKIFIPVALSTNPEELVIKQSPSKSKV